MTVSYIIRSFDSSSGIMKVEYPDWGNNGTSVTVRLEPDKQGNVITGSLLDKYLQSLAPPPVIINNAIEVETLVVPEIQQTEDIHIKYISVDSFTSKVTPEELGTIWIASYTNPVIATFISTLVFKHMIEKTNPVVISGINALISENFLSTENASTFLS